jgi:hypothetical protein
MGGGVLHSSLVFPSSTVVDAQKLALTIPLKQMAATAKKSDAEDVAQVMSPLKSPHPHFHVAPRHAFCFCLPACHVICVLTLFSMLPHVTPFASACPSCHLCPSFPLPFLIRYAQHLFGLWSDTLFSCLVKSLICGGCAHVRTSISIIPLGISENFSFRVG